MQRSTLVLIGCLLVHDAAASIPASPCLEEATAGLSLGYYAYTTTAVEPTDGSTHIDRYSADLGFRVGEHATLGAGYRGTHLNESGIGLQTNGYLHTFLLPLDVRFHSRSGRWRLGLAPALSGSSNVVKDSGEWEREAWQILAALVGERELNRQLELRFGVCADHLFGAYRVYPMIALGVRAGSRGRLEIGFPRTQLAYPLSKSVQTRVAIAPVGNSWLVKDKALEQQSTLHYESWSVEWQVSWTPVTGWRLSASLGREFQSRYDATLTDGRRISLEAAPVTRIGLELARAW